MLVARGELVLFSTRAKNFVHAYDLGVARIEFRVLASSSFAVILTVREPVPNAILARKRVFQSEILLVNDDVRQGGGGPVLSAL